MNGMGRLAAAAAQGKGVKALGDAIKHPESLQSKYPVKAKKKR